MLKFNQKRNKFCCLVLFFVMTILSVAQTGSAAEAMDKAVSKIGWLNNDKYTLMGGMEIVDDTVYVFKATSKNLSDVALFSAPIDGMTMKIGEFSLVEKFRDYELGHANDCTYYDGQLFVAPYGKNTVKGVTTYYSEGGKVGGRYYPVVSVNIKDGTKEAKGYELKDMSGVPLSERRVGGICRIDDMTYGIYPVFCLKSIGGTLMYCYLKDGAFYNYYTCKVTRPRYGGYKNLGQGVSYHKGYLYFGLGVLNGKGVCGPHGYICRIENNLLNQYASNVCEPYYLSDYSELYDKFEVECITFYNGYCLFNVNGVIHSEPKGYGEDAICIIGR